MARETKAEKEQRLTMERTAQHRAMRKQALSKTDAEKDQLAKALITDFLKAKSQSLQKDIAQLDEKIGKDFMYAFEWGYMADRYEFTQQDRQLQHLLLALGKWEWPLTEYVDALGRQYVEAALRKNILPTSSGQFRNISDQLEFSALQKTCILLTEKWELKSLVRRVYGDPKSSEDQGILAEIAAERATVN